jgi:general secretion pathway protein L
MSADHMTDGDELKLQDAIMLLLRNWWQELTAFAQQKLASLGEWPRAQIMLHIGANAIAVCRLRGHRTQDIAVISTEAKQSLAKDLSQVFREAELGKDVLVTLPADQVLRPSLVMPKARRASLQGALRYEVERVSPINHDDLYYDFVVDDAGNDTVAIELRMIRKALVDDAITLCRVVGLTVAAIYFEGDQTVADWRAFPVNLFALLRTFLARFGLLILSGLATILVVLLLFGAYLHGAAMLDGLSSAVADAGVRAARVERLNDNIDHAAKDLVFAARQKRSPFFVSELAELTKTLPDGTWITELTMDGTKMRIQGASTEASNLIGLIDHSAQFTNAKFEAPLVHDASTKVDRFDLSFDVVGGPP